MENKTLYYKRVFNDGEVYYNKYVDLKFVEHIFENEIADFTAHVSYVYTLETHLAHKKSIMIPIKESVYLKIRALSK